MKTAVLVLVTMIVGSLASPLIPTTFDLASEQDVSRNERIVTGQIVQAIDDATQWMRDNGLDPFQGSMTVNEQITDPIALTVNAVIDNLNVNGLSNIVVEDMNFSILRSTLTFNIVLPGVGGFVDNIDATVNTLDNQYTGVVSGSLNVNAIRLRGSVRVNIGAISGISVRDLTLNFSVGSIVPNLNVNWLGQDVSAEANNLLGNTIPQLVTTYESQINAFLEDIALRIINEILGNNFFF